MSGRGGYGSISGSRSCSHDPSGILHSTGTGNMAHGDGLHADSVDVKERASHAHSVKFSELIKKIDRRGSKSQPEVVKSGDACIVKLVPSKPMVTLLSVT
jgi:hypothetical protein